ncbi:hypothetical protein ACJJTC_012424 [Scirpophaga incertulas]
MVLTLYKLDASPPVRAVYMTLEALGIENVQMQDVNLFTKDQLQEAYLNLNPQHTMQHYNKTHYLFVSHAIAAYLVNKYAPGHSLYPVDPKKRAIIDQRLHFDSGILFPALRGTVGPVFFGGEKQFRPDNLEKLKSGYDFLERFLTEPWLAGSEFTLADICCVATVSSMNVVLPINGNEHRKLYAWFKRCSTQEIVKKRNQPGIDVFSEALKSFIA